MDIEHYFIEKGQGDPLILLHGNGESSDYFVGQIDVFAQRYHVYALDTRGHGKTPRGDAPFTIRQFADDLRVFMDVHQIEKAHLLGFSDGGNIAMVFALKYPERVDRLILDGANLDAKGVKRSIQIPIEIGYWFACLFACKSEEARRHAEMLGLMVHDPNVLLDEFVKAGADMITVHYESPGCAHLDRVIQRIHSLGVKAGVALNPATPETVLDYVNQISDCERQLCPAR